MWRPSQVPKEILWRETKPSPRLELCANRNLYLGSRPSFQ